tara:strand:- start:13497 stop:14255 length:759 start_codon:yes stop_codon:yes gene_type:complete
MNKVKSLIFLLTLAIFVNAQQKYPFEVGESCTYRIHYGPITAGYGSLKIKAIEEHLGEACFLFDGFGETNNFFDFIFEVNDSYISYSRTDSLLPVHFIRDVYEGGHIIQQDYLFTHRKKQVLAEDSIYKIASQTQDMISAFYYARALLNKQNIKKDSTLKFNIFMDEEIYPMQIKYLNNELVRTRWGKINCMLFVPQLQVGRIFKDQQEMRIWISDDENKLMIKVETKIIVGSIKAELSSFEGLKNPLSITD